MINPIWLALFFGLSEVLITRFLRSGGGSRDADKGSLRLIWLVINVSMVCAILAYLFLPAARLSQTLYWPGLALFVFGLALRWYSIAYLGRFFTVDVAVAADHRVMDTGPYRFIRHPSYTGSLTAFVGLALCFGNIVSIGVIIVPITTVFLHRMRIEEAALQSGVGQAYTQYMSRTKRLIPFVY